MKTLLATAALAITSSALFSAPVTTVPWNGYPGAVSFTYDDARVSQLPNLLPQLDSLHLKATFEIAALAGLGNFTSRRADWLQVSRNGHELANHTYNHENMTDANAAAKVKEMADTLRGLDPSIQSVTFAYPNCTIPGTTGKNGVSAENFIGRGCANTSYQWGTQPTDWMNIQALIMQPSNQSTGVALLTTAKSNRWASFVIHDVADPTPDVYSITPANNLQLLTTAISNGLWIDTYSNVAAYYRSHFTIDTAKAVVNGSGWKVTWVSPHPKMPKSVALRVKLDSTVFNSQGRPLLVWQDTMIIRQTDGSYVVDFMKLRLDAEPYKYSAISQTRKFNYAPLRTRITGRNVTLRGLPEGSYAFSLRNANGALVQQRNLRMSGTGEAAFTLNSAPPSGIYQITLRQSSTGTTRNISLLVLQ